MQYYFGKIRFIGILAFVIILLFSMGSCSRSNRALPFDLTVSEGFTNPLGFYDPSPTFSWKLYNDENTLTQTKYHIVVASSPTLLPENPDLWNSGIVKSDQSTFVNYEGEPFISRQKVYWQIKYQDQDGKESAWSEVANFEMGLLNNADWKAKWISYTNKTPERKTQFNTPYFTPQYLRKEFNANDEIIKARLYMTAKGVFEVQLNGKKVGEEIMPPGWTPYTKRIETLTFDVTEEINNGNNAIGIILTEGWYSGRIGWGSQQWNNTDPPKAIGQLEIYYKKGDSVMIVTDATWKATQNGPLRYAGIYDGEFYDSNFEMPDWSKAGFNEKDWKNVEELEIDDTVKLQAKRNFPVRDKIELACVGITQAGANTAIFDLGQNMTGVASVNVPVKKGDTLTIRFAEMLQKNGQLYTENYRAALSTDYYVASVDGIVNWRPKFTFHGFRYVQLSGYDAEQIPKNDWVKGIVQYTDFDIIGKFHSSSEKLNQLHSNITWGLRSNFFDVPTDCPQRNERLGFTGDAQVFIPTSLYISNSYAFWSSWMQSMREEQFPDGGLPILIPNLGGTGSSAGWSDAAAVIPWETYLKTGNLDILNENYNMIKQWISYHQTRSNEYISSMGCIGDWLQPYSTNEDPRRGDTPVPLMSTAYFANSVSIGKKAAQALGREDDAAYFSAKHDSIQTAFTGKYFNAEGKIINATESQTGYLMAIGFSILHDTMVQKAIPHLLRVIEDADNHLRTGFLGTPLLAPVLDKAGEIDLMYEILFKESYPSWFYSINQGATTMWERWDSYSHKDGFGPNGMNSFNHYAYGAIGQWIYERIIGISPLSPGFKKIRFAPIPGKQLDFAEGEFESVYGPIKSSWKVENNEFILSVTIPPNTSARIELPVKYGKSLLLNGEVFNETARVHKVSSEQEQIVLEALPGVYNLKLQH